MLRTVGTVNIAAVLLGSTFLLERVYRFLTGRITEPRDAPHFRFAFAAMALIEVAFATVLLATAIRFLQAKLSAVKLYSVTVLLLGVHFVVVGELWRSLPEIANSVAAATAVSSATTVFTFLFLAPFLYPLLSVVLLQLLKRRYENGRFRSKHGGQVKIMTASWSNRS